MNIGQAVGLMKDRRCVGRPGWNGKGMFLYLFSGQTTDTVEQAEESYFGVMGEVKRQDAVMMKTADDTVVPWLCSQSDLLAEDWEEVLPFKAEA